MDKALKMARVTATGSLHLFIGMVASNVIMAVGTIILARLLLPEEYGLYSIALTPALMITLFRDWGINSAMTRYIAHSKASNEEHEVRQVVIIGFIFEVAMGLILSFVSLLLASYIALAIFHRQESASLISIASITIFAGALFAASQSCFVGFERMKLSSFTVISQAIVKTLISPLLVFLGYGALGAVLGYTFSFVAAGIIGLMMFYLIFFRNLKKNETSETNMLVTLRTMLRYGVPLSISTILAGFLVQFYGFMIAYFCNDLMIGNYKVAVQFAVLLSFFAFPISTVLFPAFAKLNPKNENRLIKTVFTSSVKYTAMLLVPATMAVIVLSKPMVYTLFGDVWVHAPLFLALYVVNFLFVVFGNMIIGSLLTGLGETKMLMKLSLLTLFFGVPLAFLLIPTYGIVGAIVGSIVAPIPSMGWSIYWTWKHYEAKADFSSSFRISIASTLAAIATYLFLVFFENAEWLRLTIGGAIFLLLYLLLALKIGAINKNDIDNFRVMLSGLGILSKFIDILLTLAERIWKASLFNGK